MNAGLNSAPFDFPRYFQGFGLQLKLLNLMVSRVILCGCRAYGGLFDYRIRDAESNGIVVTSIAYWGSRAASKVPPEARARVSLYYRSIGKGAKGCLSFDAAFSQSDLSDVAAELFVLELEPGEYEFYDFKLERGCSAISSRREFSIPFTVERGRIAYIGEHNLDLITGRSMYGPGL